MARVILLLAGLLLARGVEAEDLVRYAIVGDAITKPLTATPGDTERGRRVAAGIDLGNCLACHVLPIPEEQFNGTIGPDLRGVASRLTPGQLRLRIVNPRILNPASVMPAYYRVDGLHRVRADMAGKPILSAQQIEDLIAFLINFR
jgi:sulfur-oxidizing protein SoxX